MVIFFTIVAIYLKERNFQGQNTENKGKSAHFQQNSSNVPQQKMLTFETTPQGIGVVNIFLYPKILDKEVKLDTRNLI